jgi:natural product biosynthesis luciferase-like monooxygenase protein
MGRAAPSDAYRHRVRHQRRCNPDVTARLHAAADRMGVALSTLVYGAWGLLLRRYTRQQDVVCGAVRAGRHLPLEHAETGVGVYINTVPLRIRVAADQPVGAWLQEVQRTRRALRDHEHVPLAQIQAWSEVPAGRDLFESLVVFDRATIDAQVHAGREDDGTRHFRLLQHTSYPLNLYVYGGEALSLELEFDPGRFVHLPMDRILPYLETLLRGLASDPDRPVGNVPELGPDERALLVEDWHDTDRDYDVDASIHGAIAAQAAVTPDATAIAYKEDTLTYAALDQRANRLAHHLRQNGVRAGDRVGICMTRSTDLVVGLLAILKAGAAYVPLDPSYPAERVQLMIEDAGLEVIATRGAPTALDGFDGRAVELDREAAAIGKMRDTPPDKAPGGDALAYVIYTSGSTGRPKGVMVTHRNVANFFAGMDGRISLRDGDRPGVWLAVTSISFDISVLELFWTLARGFKVVLQPDHATRAAELLPSGRQGASNSQVDYDEVSPGQSADEKSVRKRPHASEPAEKIDFSLFYFSSDEKLDADHGAASDKYRLLLEGARFGDQNGFAAVWTPERHFHDFGGLYPNPSVISAAIAAETERIGIRAGSCVAPLHHPVRIAEDWAVVDNLSGGRAGISFASGWQPDDFVLDPAAYAERKAIMFERIEQVRALWQGEALAFDDAEGGETTVRTLPRPVQADLPVWVTAAGNPETFRRTGAGGYHLLTHLLGQTIDELTEKIAIYRSARADNGYDPEEGTVTVMLHTFVGEDDAAVRETVRGPMKDYLRSSIGLIKKAAWSFPAFKEKTTGSDGGFTMEHLTEKDLDEVLEFSFSRYYETSGLFGTPERCLEQVDRLRRCGVDEIACLLDFGLPAEQVLDHLPLLAEVRQRARQAARTTAHGAATGNTTRRPDSPAADRSESSSTDYSIAAQIARHGVTHLQCTPSQARMLVADASAHAALGHLDHMLVGGETLPVELAKTLRTLVPGTLTNMYGPTETTIWSTTHRIENVEGPVPIGRPIANTQIYILDDDREPVPVGVTGELYIGGDGVTRGYLDREALTAERFLDDPFRPGKRMYRTGDLARYRPDGVIEFLGREDFQVKIRGHRIELGEIEAALEAISDVEVAVVLVHESDDDGRLVAYVQPTGANADAAALRDALKAKLPPIMVPGDIVVLDAFPLTPNGKIDRQGLAVPGRSRDQAEEPHTPPENTLEETVVRIWQEVLQVDTVGVTDNFFDLGGHSLLAVQVMNRLMDELQRDISVVALFQYPTVRSLARHLDAEDDSGGGVAQGQDRARRRREALLSRRGN